MKRRKFLLLIVPLAVTVSVMFWMSEWTRRPKLRAGRTNVLVLIVDTLRADHLGCYGYERPTSVNMDALAAKGVVFEQAVANCSWTRPSIASLLTGVYPRTTGVYKEKFDALSPEVVTLAEMFQLRGYVTLGVTANPSINSDFGFARGFDDYGDCARVWDWMKPKGDRVPNTERLADLEGAKSVTDRTLALLERTDGRPFYLQVLYIDPHTPYQPPKSFEHPLNQNPEGMIDLYDAEIAYADEQIGRLLNYVSEHHPNTLVVLLSDHGEGLLDHRGLPLSSTHGYYLYDSVLAVPLIFHHPEMVSGGRFSDQVQLLDLVPTLAELFDLQPDESVAGTSLAPILWGEAPPSLPDQVFSETSFKGVNKFSVREQAYKLVINKGSTDNFELMATTERGLRMRKAAEASGPAELYLIPGGENPTKESLNLIAVEPEVGQRLKESIADWEARTPAREPVNLNNDVDVDLAVIRQLKALGYLD